MMAEIHSHPQILRVLSCSHTEVRERLTWTQRVVARTRHEKQKVLIQAMVTWLVSSLVLGCASRTEEGAADGDSQGLGGQSSTTSFLGGPSEADETPDELVDADADTVLRLAGVRSSDSALGRLLVEAETGRTLYTFGNDTESTSSCTGSCAVIWTPLFATDSQQQEFESLKLDAAQFSLLSGFDIIVRPDFLMQWSFNGSPLYTFEGDSSEGDTNGEGQDDLWFVARPFAWRVFTDSSGRQIFRGQGSANAGLDLSSVRRNELTDLTLYTFTRDTFGFSNCNTGCSEDWPPFYVDRGARARDGFTQITRNNGAAQWAFNGQPLYFYIEDRVPGDITGEALGGVWFLATP